MMERMCFKHIAMYMFRRIIGLMKLFQRKVEAPAPPEPQQLDLSNECPRCGAVGLGLLESPNICCRRYVAALAEWQRAQVEY